MTRINSGIYPRELPTKLLLAEHREIKRIPNAIIKGRFSLMGRPERFCLGRGHVRFFYDKLLYLTHRYLGIYDECLKRAFDVQYYGESFLNAKRLYPELYNPYTETEDDRRLIISRIRERGFDLINEHR